ncbi:MAG TPA: lysophospholipid acyltransferase family protein [Candidatus Gracilibacteria bacterium]|nr:lysophospholipid acyltransferase family protein [Candidatus Gracilibacteria bacterium]
MEVAKVGEIFGKHIGKPVMDVLRKQAKDFPLFISGLNNLQALAGEPYVLVSNHVRPDVPLFKQSGASPDVFLLERAVAEETGRQLKIVARSDSGHLREGDYQRRFQQEFEHPFMRGLIGGMDLIPVKRVPGRINLGFVKQVRKAISEGNPLLIFPEGRHSDDFDENTNLKSGFEYVASKFSLRILPAYIQGCNSWRVKENVHLGFGEPIAPWDYDAEEIPEITKRKILALKEQQRNEVELGRALIRDHIHEMEAFTADGTL